MSHDRRNIRQALEEITTMTGAELGYLILSIGAMAVFGGVLAWVSWPQNK